SPQRRRFLRAVELLEALATPKAVKELERLAGGAEGASLTTDAKGALARVRDLGNLISGNSIGVIVTGRSQNTKIIGNIIRLNSNGEPIAGVPPINGAFYGNTQDGIRLFSANGVTVRGNVLSRNGQDGIRVALSYRVFISNNNVGLGLDPKANEQWGNGRNG